MKYFILLLKLALFTVLVFIRLGEWDISHLYQWSKYRNSLEFYISALASIAIFLLLLDFIQVAVTGWYKSRHRISRDDNFIIGVGQIYQILLVAGIVVGILSLFQIDVKQLFTSLSIIFAGIAILTKDYITNMINGMIITFSAAEHSSFE
jgi:hypothetical protein